MKYDDAEANIRKQHIIITPAGKSIVLALVLSLFLGPVGVVYTSVAGAIITGSCALCAWWTGSVTLLALSWGVSMIWAVTAAIASNRTHLKG